MTMDLTPMTVVRLTCDRCGAIAETTVPGNKSGDQGGWRNLSLLLTNFPDWQRRDSDGREHLCPACTASYRQWLEAGHSIVPEGNSTAVTQIADARQRRSKGDVA
jgi:hypothetical protein